ncbi:MAG TPA: hypothetical protein VMB66_11400 [Candidatus Acidoferrales bacterium]|nr:hypothetical protein [Candidatus Acidoferrales bacterium]
MSESYIDTKNTAGGNVKAERFSCHISLRDFAFVRAFMSIEL